ncbi:MAG: DNA polymerase III subunit alpha [Flavobacteriales bacterium]|nr:DNA polymerase III subunit alpha [Flavobacteriales bacterium]
MYLNNHTYYSLRYGTIKPEDLLQMAKDNGVKELALTDINSTSACMDMIRLSPKYGVRIIVGVDFRNGAEQQYVVLAKNNEGFRAINTYLSKYLHKGEAFLAQPDLMKDTVVIYPYHGFSERSLEANEYLGVKPQDLNRLRFSKWNRRREKLVVLQTVSFQSKKGFNTHRLLRAIANNTLLSKLQIEEQGSEDDVMLPVQKLMAVFSDFPELISNTNEVLRQCGISFDFSGSLPANQSSYSGNEELDYRFVEKLCYSGLHYRYKKPGKRIFARIKKELEVIKEKKFISYFLINWKILKYARQQGYFYVGRGSGANSIVAYLLRITDVDPVELDLYFERFINLYRKNPPDFDIDFSWMDRDDVIRFIFDHFPNAALLTVYNTFQYKAAVRELGKVFGLPKLEMDVLTRGKFQYKSLDKISKLVLTYSQLLQGFPNYLGIHSSGIVISEKPLHCYTATFMPPKGFPTTQFDMVVAEDIGLYKFDILSQRGLGKIKDTVGIIKYNQPNHKPFDIHDIKAFKKDNKIKHILRNAQAIGCFYVESPAMRMLLKKLQVDNYLGLVAASSVIRPGVAKSGMMREYILRYRYPEKRKEAHYIMLDIMPETFGVMVYQEDVIKVAHYFGGLSLGEADMLRRGMSGKFRSRDEFMKVKDKFFDNCADKGHSLELVREVWRQIESFAGYAFAKGHSASYAVESYQSLFLKAHYPLEYMVATINNFGGFYRTELYVHEAKMHGATINAPNVNKSGYETIIKGKQIYLGFILLRSLETKVAKSIVRERERSSEYIDLDNFIDRVRISMEQISILIKVNAFRFTERNKRELLWESHMKINKIVLDEQVVDLFKVERMQYETPKLPSDQFEDAFDEIEHIGFPMCNSFDILQDPPKSKLLAKDLVGLKGKKVTIVAAMVTVKNTKTANDSIMHFGTFIDYVGDFVDTVHFPSVASRFPFRGRGIYSITGVVTEEFDCYSIEVESMERLPIIEDPRYLVPNKAKKVAV